MKTLLTFLLLASLSAFAQDGTTVRSRNGNATNLTIKGITVAQQIVATNYSGNGSGLTNLWGESNVKFWGAKGDGQIGSGRITAASTFFTNATVAFVAADVGKSVWIAGAGTAGVAHYSTVATIVTPSVITLAAAAISSVTSTQILWGTDDTAAIASAVNAQGDDVALYYPEGRYHVTTISGSGLTITDKRSVSLFGSGWGSVIVRNNSGRQDYIGEIDDCQNVTVANLAFDLNNVDRYGGFVINTSKGVSFRNCLIYDSNLAATWSTYDHYGIVFQNVTNVNIAENTLMQSQLEVSGTCENVTINNNVISDAAGTAAIAMVPAPDSGSLKTIKMSQNQIVDPKKNGIYIQSETYRTNITVSGVSITENQIYHKTTAGSGISVVIGRFTGSAGDSFGQVWEDIEVSDNTILLAAGPTRTLSEIAVDHKQSGFVFNRMKIKDNNVQGNAVVEWALDLRKLTNSLINGNKSFGTAFGMVLVDIVDSEIKDNYVEVSDTAYSIVDGTETSARNLFVGNFPSTAVGLAGTLLPSTFNTNVFIHGVSYANSSYISNGITVRGIAPQARVSASSGDARFYLATAGTDRFIINHDGSIAQIGTTGDGGDLAFMANGTIYQTIKNDGKVGIGTPTPAAKLDVAGDILTAGNLLFEGIDNGFETTFTVTDPTADRTVTFQNASGTVAYLSDISAGGGTNRYYEAGEAFHWVEVGGTNGDPYAIKGSINSATVADWAITYSGNVESIANFIADGSVTLNGVFGGGLSMPFASAAVMGSVSGLTAGQSIRVDPAGTGFEAWDASGSLPDPLTIGTLNVTTVNIRSNSWMNIPVLAEGDNVYASSNGTPYIVSLYAGAQTTNAIGGSGSAPSDTAFASSWNGVTTIAPSMNAVYDWGHIFDTDDDGLVNVLDSTFTGGAGTFSGQIRIADGTLASPGLQFNANDYGLGFYRSATNQMRFSANGGYRMTFDGNGLSMNSPLTMESQTLAKCSTITFLSDQAMQLLTTAGQLRLVSGRLIVDNSITATVGRITNATAVWYPPQAGDPTTPPNGSSWYDTTANEFTARINGTNVSWGADADANVILAKGLIVTNGLSVNASVSAIRVGGTLKVNTTTTGNVGADEDNLVSYSVPAGLLVTSGDFIEFDVWGTCAANTNPKQIKVYFGGAVLLDTTAVVLNGNDWRGHGKIVRTGAATQTATCEFTVGGTLLSAVNSTISDTTAPTETLSGAVTFKCTGTSTVSPNDNDIAQNGMVLKWNPGQ